jgi:adenosylmethionine-8-amino-7-oxononanoate aminotransferase
VPYLRDVRDHRYLLPVGSSAVRPTIVAAEGVELIDDAGHRYLDAAAGVGVACLGYSAADVAEAMRAQASTIPYVHALRFDTPVVAELAAEIAALAPTGVSAVFFTSGGSEANESAVKLAVQYWAVRGRPAKWKVIGRQPSYHGNTLGALALGWHAGRRRRYGPLLLSLPHVPAPNQYRGCACCDGGCTLACAGALEETIEREGAESVAAFIAEPVIGAAGGALLPPHGYFAAIREICDRHDVLLIADEVLTGFGRLGAPFGTTLVGMRPDMLTFGKGVAGGYAPLAGVVAHERIAAALREAGTPFEHSFTMAAHPVACAAGLATVRRLRDDGLMERAARVGGAFASAVREALRNNPIVGDVRGMGLLLGVELVRDCATKEPFPAGARMAGRAAEAALSEGLLVYACSAGAGPELSGGDALLLMPPLITSELDLTRMALLLGRALDGLAEG